MPKVELAIDYVHIIKEVGQRDAYRVDLHSRAGVSPFGCFSAKVADRIRFHQRNLRGKKLTEKQWREFVNGVE